MAYSLIDTEDSLRDALRSFPTVSTKLPAFYFDCEGHELGRHGTLDLLQVYVLPLQHTFVIDIYVLQDKAFTTTSGNLSLKSLLQSKDIKKVFFDVRNDSDALFSHFNVSLRGIIDLQLMEYFLPERSGINLLSLRDCIDRDSALAPEVIENWKQNKASITGARSDSSDGRNPPSQQRPVPDDLLQYSVGDVEYLPRLFRMYRSNLDAQRWGAVYDGSNRRVKQSQHMQYEPQGKNKWKGPHRGTNLTSSRASSAIAPMRTLPGSALSVLSGPDKVNKCREKRPRKKQHSTNSGSKTDTAEGPYPHTMASLTQSMYQSSLLDASSTITATSGVDMVRLSAIILLFSADGSQEYKATT